MTTTQEQQFKLEKIEYVARQDLSETFADSMTTILFDGQMAQNRVVRHQAQS